MGFPFHPTRVRNAELVHIHIHLWIAVGRVRILRSIQAGAPGGSAVLPAITAPPQIVAIAAAVKAHRGHFKPARDTDTFEMRLANHSEECLLWLHPMG